MMTRTFHKSRSANVASDAPANISFVTAVGRTSLAVKVKSNEKPAGYRQKPVSPEGRCAQTETQN